MLYFTLCDEAELRKFAGELVDSLYAAVRAKLVAMLEKEYSEMGADEVSQFPKDELLARADEEVRGQVGRLVFDIYSPLCCVTRR